MSFSSWGNAFLIPNYGGAAYVPPLDGLSSIAAAYSVRKLRTLYAGNAFKLRRDSDNAELDVGFISNGGVDTAAIATWLGAANGFVTTWYDQSGNGKNATQTTTGLQPLYVANVINSKPVLRWSSKEMILVSLSVASGDKSIVALLANSSTAGNLKYVLDSATGRLIMAHPSNTVGKVGWYDGGWKEGGSPVATAQSLIYVFAGSTGYVYRNGAEVFNAAYTAKAIGGLTRLGSINTGGSSYYAGDMAEIIIFSDDLTTANRQAIERSHSSYFGITLS